MNLSKTTQALNEIANIHIQKSTLEQKYKLASNKNFNIDTKECIYRT